MQINLYDAVVALGVTGFSFSGKIVDNSEETFNALFQKVVGQEEDGTAIFSSDPSDFGVTYSEVAAKLTELQADYEAKQYQRDRVYPSIQEQLDMQYWDSVNGTTTWADAIAQVKADNPKP